MDSSPQLHDHSTLPGKIASFLHRLNWNLILPLSALAAIVLVAYISIGTAPVDSGPGSLIFGPNDTSATNSSSLGSGQNFVNGNFTFSGKDGVGIFFPGFTLVQDPKEITSLEISNVEVDALSFSKNIRPFFNLKSITLDNVTLVGDFERVTLKNLVTFYINIIIPATEKVSHYKEQEKLKSLLFFDKVNGTTWDLLTQVCDLGVDITVKAGGTKVISVNRKKGEIALNVPYCDPILENVKGAFKILSLSMCNVSKSSIPSDLIYINLYNIKITHSNLSQVIKNFKRLTDFFGAVPDETVDLSDFPKTLNFLTLSSMNITYNSGYVSPGMRDLSLGGETLSPQVIENFDKIFPTVNRVAIFGLKTRAHELFSNIMKTKASWVVMEDFERKPNSTDPIELEVEIFLKKIGVPDTETNFLVFLPEMEDKRVGVSLTEYQKNFFRFTLLGWYKFDSFESYLRVVNIFG